MKVEIEKQDAEHLKVSGTIDVDNAVDLKAEGEALLKSCGDMVHVDLSGVKQSSSVGVSLLLCWARAAKLLGKDIQYHHMPGKMFDVARVSGLDDVLPIVSNGD